MQQRQLRLGDILDDYCPRERRLTNHAVVAMVGTDVKQTRCTTCDAEHEYKHARVPRQRRKTETPAALYSQVLAGAPKGGPKRVLSEAPPAPPDETEPDVHAAVTSGGEPASASAGPAHTAPPAAGEDDADADAGVAPGAEDGPVHRPLIRATLPRPDGQLPPTRPVPEFTIRQPAARPNRFRPRHPHGGQMFHGNRANGNVPGMRGGPARHGGNRPPAGRPAARHGRGRKRSK